MIKKVSDKYKELYHYTSAEGLQGIIQSQQLWATHIHYLNDHKEFNKFFEVPLFELMRSSIDEFVSKEKQALVHDVIATHGSISLTTIIEHLPKDISYNEIRMVLAANKITQA